jgi:hypothetical protein
MSTRACVDARLITSLSEGDRPYPLSPAMYEVGYGFFEPLHRRPDLPPLWSLATSDDPAKRLEFLRVMDLFEGTDALDPRIIDLAFSIYADSRNRATPVQLLEGKDGRQTYAIVAGERHVLAVLWLWCKGLYMKPLVQAQVMERA